MKAEVEAKIGVTKKGSHIRNTINKFNMNSKVTVAVSEGSPFTGEKGNDIIDGVTRMGGVTVNQSLPGITNFVTSLSAASREHGGLSELIKIIPENAIVSFDIGNMSSTANVNLKLNQLYRHIAVPPFRKVALKMRTRVLDEYKQLYYSGWDIRQYVF